MAQMVKVTSQLNLVIHLKALDLAFLFVKQNIDLQKGFFNDFGLLELLLKALDSLIFILDLSNQYFYLFFKLLQFLFQLLILESKELVLLF